MRLLAPSQAADIAGQETARDVLRVGELRTLEKQAREKLGHTEAEFDEMMARKRAEILREEEEHERIKRERQKEIDELEVKKLNALIPFDILKEGTDDRMKNAQEFMDSLRNREENVEERLELLEDKLDEVGAREMDVKRQEQKQQIAQEGIDAQKDSIRLQSEKLTQSMTDFAAQKAQEEVRLDERNTTLFLKERSLLAKEDSLERREAENGELAKRLHDERQVLDRAWKELGRK